MPALCRKRNAGHPRSSVGNGASIRGDRRDGGPQPVQHQPRSSAAVSPSNENSPWRARTGRKTESRVCWTALHIADPISAWCSAESKPRPYRLSHDRAVGAGVSAGPWRSPLSSTASCASALRPRRCSSRAFETIYRWSPCSTGRFGNAGRGACREGTTAPRTLAEGTSPSIPAEVPISERRESTAGAFGH